MVLSASGFCHLMTSLERTSTFPAYILLRAKCLIGNLVTFAHTLCQAGTAIIPISQMRKQSFRRFSNCLRSHSGEWRPGSLLHHQHLISQHLLPRLHAGITWFQTYCPGPSPNQVRIKATHLQTRNLEPRDQKWLARSGTVSLGQAGPEFRTR